MKTEELAIDQNALAFGITLNVDRSFNDSARLPVYCGFDEDELGSSHFE